MAPLEATGRVLGVYVIDEPLHNGISQGDAAAAVARVRADGYRTMVAETYSMYAKTLRETGSRLDFGADWYGLTAYDTKPEWVADRYREDGRLNVVFCSSDDDSDGRRLAATARARGLFRWSLDMGAAAHSMPRRLP
jgi:predicted acyl esterase